MGLRMAEPKVKLPRTLTEFQRRFDVVEVHPRTNWLMEYNKRDGVSFTRRRTALYSDTFQITTKDSPVEEMENDVDDEEQRLESLIKSITLTPDAYHDKDIARHALAKFGKEKVEKGMSALLDKRLLSKNNDTEKLVPGRAYKMSDKCLSPLPFRTF
jgi:hypothetical protein